MRIGIGYDVHRLVAGRSLILGGVRIPSEVGLDGHSDADVLTHALIDALLGAAALGDIGAHFPDTDEVWRGADSIELMRAVMDLPEMALWRIGNVDATVIMERPRLRPHIEAIQTRLAEALGVDPGHVSVKATTHERLGPLGREEGAAAHAACILFPREA